MCGIVGIAALGAQNMVGDELIARMAKTIGHRGPDDDGFYRGKSAHLGMRRLAVIDVNGGQQPIANEDGTIHVVFNGEIYNYRELRADLTLRGHRFSTDSDTEVIVHAYEEHGLDFVLELNGMFAFSLYDENDRRLILARDHLGIKPLYYAIVGDHVIWGSEIKALLSVDMIPRSLNSLALSELLTWEYVPAPRTLFDGINKLPPATILAIDLESGKLTERQYWDVPVGAEKRTRSQDEWREMVESQLKKSVRRQMVSDVPLGAFLSGGVDSSLIVAAMGEAKTFSIGFDDPSYNELAYSGEVARHLGVEHITEIVRADVVDLFDHLMTFMDDPIGDFSIFPTFLVSRLARAHVTVALSGDGGDELFGGYETYIADRRANVYAALPRAIRQSAIEPLVGRIRPSPEKKGLINKLKRFVEGCEFDGALSHARWRIFMSDRIRQQLLVNPVTETESIRHLIDSLEAVSAGTPLEKSLYADVKTYLSDNILTKVDRMSMAVSLETRVPFLDPDLVELAFQLPDSCRIQRGQTKILLKEIAAAHVPRHCVYRPKEGFSIPIKNWLGGQFKPLMDDLLSQRRIDDGNVLRWKEVDRLKQEHLSGATNHSHLLWTMMVFEAWRERWLRDSTPLTVRSEAVLHAFR
jgi:asparagine synthase (glutamine-hydrolysing)